MKTRSGAFTANYTNPEFLNQLWSYTKALARPVSGRDNVVGAIVAFDGKPQTVDIFHSTPLFRKLWPKLLQSHVLDALSTARRGKARPPTAPCTLTAARQFLHSVVQANVGRTETSQTGLAVTRRETQQVISFSAGLASPAEARGMGMGGMGGFGGGVHASGYAK